MPSERQIIDKIRRLTDSRNPLLSVPLGDDAAVLHWPSESQIVLAKDVLAQDRHFSLDWAVPEFLAEKSLAVNLSDLAAMGAEPVACLLGLTLASFLKEDYVDRFLRAFTRYAADSSCPLVGGDLSAGSALHVSVTVVGSLKGDPWRRDQGRPGDILVLVGEVGLSLCGLRALEKIERLPGSIRDRAGLRDFCRDQGLEYEYLEAHLLPTPQTAAARWFRQQIPVHAAIDVSDGLAGDTAAIAEASSSRAILDDSAIELLQKRENEKIEENDLLNGGEDYALVLCLDPSDWERAQRTYPQTLPAIRRIGELAEGSPGLAVRRGETLDPIEISRFDHFL